MNNSILSIWFVLIMGMIAGFLLMGFILFVYWSYQKLEINQKMNEIPYIKIEILDPTDDSESNYYTHCKLLNKLSKKSMKGLKLHLKDLIDILK